MATTDHITRPCRCVANGGGCGRGRALPYSRNERCESCAMGICKHADPGPDDYGRVWVESHTGIEHIVKPTSSESGDLIRNFLRLNAGDRLAYCGLVTTGLPASRWKGQERPCARCLTGESKSDD